VWAGSKTPPVIYFQKILLPAARYIDNAFREEFYVFEGFARADRNA
jgi:hypothetical protein